jgi:hypothetical protein
MLLSFESERSVIMEAICKPDFEKRVNANKAAEKAIEKAKKDGKPTSGMIALRIGFHDIYGVWYFGRLKEIIWTIGSEQFGVELGKTMHVFVDVDPEKISDGTHKITVYGETCRLYKWMAQGYHRGLVVLADDEAGKRGARVYRKSGTWSWVLS